MSTLKKGAPAPSQVKKVPPGVQSNGSGPLQLSHIGDPPDDENMNEIIDEKVNLNVMLPGGVVKQVTVDSSIPMMDLLVNLAAKSRLNPSGHTIVVMSEETGKPRDYKANQSIGSLCVKNENDTYKHTTLQIVPKKSDSDKRKSSGNLKAQPFEMTYRFTVNLPRSQKKVLRISPATTLQQLHQQICEEKHFEPSRYKFQLPGGDPMQEIDLQRTVGELKTNEINFISRAILDGAKSMPDLSISRSQSMRTEPNQSTTPYMPSAGEGKKKKGFFSFLKKDKKFNVQTLQMGIDHGPPPVSRSVGGSPQLRNKTETSARPKTMYVTSASDLDTRPKTMYFEPSTNKPEINSKVPPSSTSTLKTVKENVPPPPAAKSGKKRRAPPPPQQKIPPAKTVEVEISVENQNVEKSVAPPVAVEQNINVNVSDKTKLEQLAHKLHSRNSSDSSGYHELTLSGAESPDAGRIDENFESLNFKTSIDTTSIDSGDNLHVNGDSGIRDVSPPRRKNNLLSSMEPGASQTLPLEKSGKKGPVRSRSLERNDPKKGAVPPRKKRAAPPPPPGAPPSVPSDTTDSGTPPPPKPCRPSNVSSAVEDKKEDDSVAIAGVLDDLNRLGDEEADEMMMVENSSIHSENIDFDFQKSTPRPCSFIAPPPPSEPPPPDSIPIDYNSYLGSRVETVDIGTETSDDSASLGPGSTKSSPVSIRGRPHSRTSMSSINTIEDINMAFELTIAAAEEAMLKPDEKYDEIQTNDEKDDEIKKTDEIDVKDDEIKKTDEIDVKDHDIYENNQEIDEKVVEIDVNDENEKDDEIDEKDEVDVIEDKIDENSDEIFENNDETDDEGSVADRIKTDEVTLTKKKMVEKLELSNRDADSDTGSVSNYDVDKKSKNFDAVDTGVLPHSLDGVTLTGIKKEGSKEGSSTEVSPRDQSSKRNSASNDYEVSEITYNFTVNSVPPEFQTEEKESVGEEVHYDDEEEEEEEYMEETITTVIYPFAQSSGPGSPRRIPDLDTPKEHVHTAVPVQIIPEDNGFSYSEPEKISNNSQIVDEEPAEIVPPEKREKEEFILTFDDLQNVDFSGPKKKISTPVTYEPIQVRKVQTVQASQPLSESRGSNAVVHPYRDAEPEIVEGSIQSGGSVRGYKGNVKNRCSELNFSPNSEGEMEHVLEEKSISLINLPAKRTSADFSDSNVEELNQIDSEQPGEYFHSSAEINLATNKSSGNISQKGDNSFSDMNVENHLNNSELESDVNVSEQAELTAQQNLLQQQLSLWQQQLEQNQMLLANQNVPNDDASAQLQQQLQAQIQIQQQMMLQMQKSMEALNIRQNQSQQQPVETLSTNVKPVSASPPPPPPVSNILTKSSESSKSVKPVSKSKSRSIKHFEPKLDPREELMIAIRNYGGIAKLRKVPVTETHWHDR